MICIYFVSCCIIKLVNILFANAYIGYPNYLFVEQFTHYAY